MTIHIGKRIKEELYRQNISVSDFAKKISKSRNVVYNIFERVSIDTELLNKIGKILNCDFFSLYSTQKEFESNFVKHFHANGHNVNYYNEQMVAIQKQNKALESEIAYLKKIIALMEGKKEK
jgi:transcriptional regulator with XRE-family HTH domain